MQLCDSSQCCRVDCFVDMDAWIQFEIPSQLFTCSSPTLILATFAGRFERLERNSLRKQGDSKLIRPSHTSSPPESQAHEAARAVPLALATHCLRLPSRVSGTVSWPSRVTAAHSIPSRRLVPHLRAIKTNTSGGKRAWTYQRQIRVSDTM